MYKFSVFLLISYFGILMFNYWVNITYSIFDFLLILIVLIFLLGSIYAIFYNYINKINQRKNFIAILCLLVPLIGESFQLDMFSPKEVLLSAYSDGVLGGAGIYFYKDGTMRYESNILIGTQVFKGNYELKDDTFKVVYLNKVPSLEYTTMTKSDKYFLFLNDEKEVGYEFYLYEYFVD